jgi:hypothetical protein
MPIPSPTKDDDALLDALRLQLSPKLSIEEVTARALIQQAESLLAIRYTLVVIEQHLRQAQPGGKLESFVAAGYEQYGKLLSAVRQQRTDQKKWQSELMETLELLFCRESEEAGFPAVSREELEQGRRELAEERAKPRLERPGQERERVMLVRRRAGETLAQVAASFGLSVERTRQLIARAEVREREEIAATGLIDRETPVVEE